VDIEFNKNLKSLNTFGLNVKAEKFIRVKKAEDLLDLFVNQVFNQKHLILGGGSNVLFKNDFKGIIIKNEIPGFKTIEEKDDNVLIEAGGGENWHEFVLKCIEQGWAGVENLSLIPGTVGAAPMQNIGAYGVEIKDTFKELTAFNLETGKFQVYSNEDCKFGYRQSIFKNELKGKYFICSVRFLLSKDSKVNISYGAISNVLNEKGISKPSIKDVSDAVIEIRNSKLPNPKEIGNAGSFFKNPIVSKDKFEDILKEYNDIPSYPLDDNSVKVPAGWLIEKAGWKGKRVGNCGSHVRQALVMVNYGGASGEEIMNLAMEIKKDVKDKFGIELSPEVNFIE
jgi:UDP-N-acetylmuramate dehydrogenase